MTSPDGQTLLCIANLSKTFDGLLALDDVSLTVPAGGVYGVIGPNGAGKTTLFNVVSGLHRATGGTVALNGRTLTGQPQHAIAALGVARTFQNLQVFSRMTVLENVQTGAHRHGRSGLVPSLLRLPGSREEERRLLADAEETLRFVGLEELADAPADSLPPGRQRMVEIARALASQPRLLLLDEPAAGLTTRETEALGELIGQIAATGLTTMLIEHDMGLVRKVCSTVAVLDQGQVLAVGTPAEIQNDSAVIAAYLGDQGDDE